MNQENQQQTILRGPNQQQILNKWNAMSSKYIKYDSAPQTFYYTLTSMLKLNEAKNILQIACGIGKLIPYALNIKNPQAYYFATDISQQMIKSAKWFLQNHFKKYQSKLTFQQWMKKQNLQFAVANGQDKIPKELKFDRIICNLVLMLTTDPKKMLQNLWQSAQQGCLLGLTIWGDKDKNPFMRGVQIISQQNKLNNTFLRSPFYLYQKIEDLVSQCGWQKILSWEQNSMFPIIDNCAQIMHIPKEHQHYYESHFNNLANVQKCGFTFDCKLMIVRKKTVLN